MTNPTPRKKRSGPYVWEYIRRPGASVPVKKMRHHKRRGLVNVVNLIANKLLSKNIAKLYMTSPKHVRNVIQPHMNTQRKIASLRSKINARTGTVNTSNVNPEYINIVRRLQRLNRTTPNNNNSNTGDHVRRVQNIQNLLGRLRMQNENMYRNNRYNKEYKFNKGILTAIPNNPRGVRKNIASGVLKRPNGTLYFNRPRTQTRN